MLDKEPKIAYPVHLDPNHNSVIAVNPTHKGMSVGGFVVPSNIPGGNSAIDYTVETLDGRLYVVKHGQDVTRVNFCPFTGREAKTKI